MHAVRALALVVALSACKADPPRPNPVHRSALAVEGGVSRPVVAPRFVSAARAARDAATKLVATCRVYAAFHDTTREYYDACRWKSAEVEPLRVARVAVRDASPDGGDGGVFAEHVALFTDWVEAVTSRGSEALSTSSRGTLAHYQELALAWNAFQPADPIPVDGGARGFSHYGQMDLDAGRGDAGHLVWGRCSRGPCVVVLAPGERL
jgi:hypothetical protein